MVNYLSENIIIQARGVYKKLTCLTVAGSQEPFKLPSFRQRYCRFCSCGWYPLSDECDGPRSGDIS